MKNSHLRGDPLGFQHALDYSKRKHEVLRLLSGFAENDYRLALKNLVWVWRRALIVMTKPQSAADAVPIWKLKTIPDVCEYCFKQGYGRDVVINLCESCKIIYAQIGSRKYRVAIEDLVAKADAVQGMMYKDCKVDIYKKLKGYKFLDEKPQGTDEVVQDISEL